MTSLRPKSICISNSVFQDLTALALAYGAGHSSDILAVSADQLGDELLRKALDGLPGMSERRKAIRKAIDEATKATPLQKPDET